MKENKNEKLNERTSEKVNIEERLNENTHVKQKQNGFYMKPYEELTIVDNFMFTKVMSNPEICKTFLEIVLDVKIKEISYPEDEKTITIASESKSVRLDVYVDDDEGIVYNIGSSFQPIELRL